ncbi:unnamed protein product [Paramecium sonneborni]|uniref:Uncharacterized protein n=1 Tax=Paramecium sonneborni TaxID=65129 RepID=A0A8S1M1H2_9CILI|nr:unnamed protein product [Paramecium sonneborni]
MSDAYGRAQKSFQHQSTLKQDISSVDVSLDPYRFYRPILRVQTSLEKIVQHQDKPCSPIPYQIQSSYDGQEMCYLMNSQNKFSFNNSLDSKLWFQRPQDIQNSQCKQLVNIPILFTSPRASQTNQNEKEQQKQNQSRSQNIHFLKEQLKFFKEDSVLSEEINHSEESSIELKRKNKNKITSKRRKKHTSDSSESFRITKKKKISKVNDTKNITKNYSKAIISYISNNPLIVQKVMQKNRYDDLVNFLKNKKNSMTNIKQLRDLWVNSGKNAEYNRVFRIISQLFLKTQAVSYVYNSRISNTQWHLKYRFNLLRALKEPENFKFIKDI